MSRGLAFLFAAIWLRSRRLAVAAAVYLTVTVVACGLSQGEMNSTVNAALILQAGVNWLLVSLALFLSGVPMVIFLLIPRSRQRAAALDVAVAQGSFTPDLRAALRDRVVIGSRAAELAIVFAVLVLMVLRPF